MESHHKRLIEMFAAAGGGTTTWLADNLHGIDPIVKSVGFYGGAFVVILSGISYGLDIYKKWKHRND